MAVLSPDKVISAEGSPMTCSRSNIFKDPMAHYFFPNLFSLCVSSYQGLYSHFLTSPFKPLPASQPFPAQASAKLAGLPKFQSPNPRASKMRPLGIFQPLAELQMLHRKRFWDQFKMLLPFACEAQGPSGRVELQQHHHGPA